MSTSLKRKAVAVAAVELSQSDKKRKRSKQFLPTDYPSDERWKELTRQLLLKHMHDDTLGIVQAYIDTLAKRVPRKRKRVRLLSSSPLDSPTEPAEVFLMLDPVKRQWVVYTEGLFQTFDVKSGKPLQSFMPNPSMLAEQDDDTQLTFCIQGECLVFTRNETAEEVTNTYVCSLNRATKQVSKRRIPYMQTSTPVCSPWSDGELRDIWVFDHTSSMFNFTAKERLVRKFTCPCVTDCNPDFMLTDPVLNWISFVFTDRDDDDGCVTVSLLTYRLDDLSRKKPVHEVSWKASSSNDEGPVFLAVSGHQCFFFTEKETDEEIQFCLQAVDLRTGKRLWKKSVEARIIAMAVDPLSSRMFCLNSKNELFMLT